MKLNKLNLMATFLLLILTPLVSSATLSETLDSFTTIPCIITNQKEVDLTQFSQTFSSQEDSDCEFILDYLPLETETSIYISEQQQKAYALVKQIPTSEKEIIYIYAKNETALNFAIEKVSNFRNYESQFNQSFLIYQNHEKFIDIKNQEVQNNDEKSSVNQTNQNMDGSDGDGSDGDGSDGDGSDGDGSDGDGSDNQKKYISKTKSSDETDLEYHESNSQDKDLKESPGGNTKKSLINRLINGIKEIIKSVFSHD